MMPPNLSKPQAQESIFLFPCSVPSLSHLLIFLASPVYAGGGGQVGLHDPQSLGVCSSCPENVSFKVSNYGSQAHMCIYSLNICQVLVQCTLLHTGATFTETLHQ